MPVHALDVFIESATKMVWIIPFTQKMIINLIVAPKICIFLYSAMETTVVRLGIGIMHSDVIDTVFHSGDAWDSMP